MADGPAHKMQKPVQKKAATRFAEMPLAREIESSIRKSGLGDREKKLIIKSVEGTLVRMQAARTRHKLAGRAALPEQAAGVLNEMQDADIRSFLEWVRNASESGTADHETVQAYGKRMLEAQKLLLSKSNMARLSETLSEPRTVELKSAMDLLPKWQNAGELSRIEREMGLTYHLVTDFNCREFIDAHAMLRAHFPTDELDPSADLMQMLGDNRGRYPGLGKPGFKKLAPDLDEPVHLRYYLIVAKDRNGKVVGAADGDFISNEKTSAMYLAHIAVPGELRRKGVATLLYSANLGLGNRYSHEAESAFRAMGREARYETPVPGNKLMYFILESEPANIESKKAVKLTFGRLMFHGRATGASWIPSLLYAQVDLEYEKDAEFRQAKWNTVPLGLLVRRLGREQETLLSVGEVRDIARVLPDLFLAADLYNPAGVKFDLAYATSKLEGKAAGEMVPVVPLPNSTSELEQVEQLAAAIPLMGGTMDERCARLYPDHLWSKEYLEGFRQARENGTAFTLEKALVHMRELARRKVDTTPPMA